MSSLRSPERRAALAAVFLSLLVGAVLWGVAYLQGEGNGGTSVSERSHWLDEPLQPPPDAPDREPLDGRTTGTVVGGGVLPLRQAGTAGRRRPDLVEAHDLAVPRHALLVDEREVRRSFAELETLDEVRAARVASLGAADCTDCRDGQEALDSQGTAARDVLLSSRARLLSRVEGLERAERSLRFVQED